MDDTFTLISRIHGEIRTFITDELAREGIIGIVPSHGAVIVALMEQEELPMNELARQIGRTPQTVTSLVKKLVENGYVETVKSAGDSRVTIACLTASGKRLASALQAISEKIYRIQYEGMTEAEIKALRSSLKRVYLNFQSTVS